MMQSLRSRILVGMMVAITFLLGSYGVVVYEAARRAMLAEFDTALLAQASMLISGVEMEFEGDGIEIEIEIDISRVPGLSEKTGGTCFQLWLDNGKVVTRSPGTGETDLERFCDEDQPVYRDITLPNGRSGRGVGILFEPTMEHKGKSVQKNEIKIAPDGTIIKKLKWNQTGDHEDDDDEDEEDADQRQSAPLAMILVFARNTDQMTEHLAGLRWILLLAGGAVVILAVLLTSVVVSRGLRPLNTVAGNIASIGANELDTRIPTEDMPTEIQPVAVKLNDLLERLESAFYRERTLTADVAHELRTPIAGVRSTIEVALSRVRNPEEYQESLTDCLTIAAVMQSLVENLLMLARLDAGQVTSRAEQIDLQELVTSSFKPLSDRAGEKNLDLHIDLPEGLSCTTDREILSIIMSNLLNNAVSYADVGGTIEVIGKTTDNGAMITVANAGCTLLADVIPNVFDRFWRGDKARANTGSHCGLGLSLVKQCMDFLGGLAEVEIKDEIFSVNLTLPADPNGEG